MHAPSVTNRLGMSWGLVEGIQDGCFGVSTHSRRAHFVDCQTLRIIFDVVSYSNILESSSLHHLLSTFSTILAHRQLILAPISAHNELRNAPIYLFPFPKAGNGFHIAGAFRHIPKAAFPTVQDHADSA